MKEKGSMTGSDVIKIREEMGSSFTTFASKCGLTYSSVRLIEKRPEQVINKTTELAIRYVYQDYLANKK